MNNNLKLIREKNELTAKEVSQKIGVSRSTYSCWENNYENISLTRLISFCNIFLVSPDYVLCLIKKDNQKFEKIEINKSLLSKNIKYIRILNGDNQLECALKLNTTQSNISYYENGNRLILSSFLYQFCKNYNTSINSMLTTDIEKN